MTEPFSPGEAMIAQGDTIVRVTHNEMVAFSRQSPRKLDDVRDEVLRELDLSPDLASRGFFEKPAGDGRTITGPSVHLARLVARNFRNCSVRSYLVGQTAEGIYSVAGVFVDLQQNVIVERVLPVSVMSWRSSGGYVELRAEQLMQAILIGASKAERNVIAAAVPDWLMQQAFSKCRILAADAAREKLPEMIAHCEKKGVSRDQLERELGGKLDSKMSDDQLSKLRGLANGLTSGDVKPGEIGERPENEPVEPTMSAADVIDQGAEVTGGIDAREKDDPPADEPAEPAAPAANRTHLRAVVRKPASASTEEF